MVELEQDAIIGLAVGFGSIVGGIILCCILWNCCCGSKEDNPKSKRKPVGPWMEMCNGSTSDVGSTKTSQTPISKGSRDSYSPKYDRNQSQEKPLRPPFKQSANLNDDSYYDRASPDYGYNNTYPESYGQPTRPPYKQTQLSDVDYSTGTGSRSHRTDFHSSDWHSDESADKENEMAIHNVKKNPEAFYQRYLY
ncbi:uncharacterized protein [Argopecten irradians]|uniref:uncharacterized protein n=1 Tax=Argopecten irradians TaxID=31199 RepID=UPI00371CC3C8